MPTPFDVEELRYSLGNYFNYVEREGRNVMRFDYHDNSFWAYGDTKTFTSIKGFERAIQNVIKKFARIYGFTIENS